MTRDLREDGVTAYLEPSRRGGHLWLFFSPTPGATVRQFGQNLVGRYDLAGIELFPKQAELKTGPGSLVRLPLGRHLYGGKTQSSGRFPLSARHDLLTRRRRSPC